MDIAIVSLIIAVFALMISLYNFYLINERKAKSKSPDSSYNSRPLQLQAYERLVMLTERISLPNLVTRTNQPGVSAREMQIVLVENIKQEYEYNTSQQIYVSPVSWQAIKKLKDQNIMIINQISQSLPDDAKAIDLNRIILEIIASQDKDALHNIVLEALNFEARKLMK